MGDEAVEGRIGQTGLTSELGNQSAIILMTTGVGATAPKASRLRRSA